MKRIIYSLLLIMVVVACKNDSKTKTFTGRTIIGEASAAPAEIPSTEFTETTALQSRFWVFEHWINVEGGPVRGNTGRWYRFYEDGTYDGGHYEDHNDHGTYFVRKGEKWTELYIDSEINDLFDAKWQLQGMTDLRDAMSWVKTKEYGDGVPAMCKLTGMLSMPTKAQFGVE